MKIVLWKVLSGLASGGMFYQTEKGKWQHISKSTLKGSK